MRHGCHIVIDGHRRHDVGPGETFSFGRADTDDGIHGLDEADMGISRLAGTISPIDRHWMITNRSQSIPLRLDVEGTGETLELSPGHRHLVNGDGLVIIVTGLARMHRIDLVMDAQRAQAETTLQPSIDTQVRHELPTLEEAELDALAALFKGFLEQFPRRDCHPLTYSEAGLLLGLPGSTVRKRIERVRARLREHGIYIDGSNARWDLARFVLAQGIIGPADLERLQPAHGPDPD